MQIATKSGREQVLLHRSVPRFPSFTAHKEITAVFTSAVLFISIICLQTFVHKSQSKNYFIPKYNS